MPFPIESEPPRCPENSSRLVPRRARRPRVFPDESKAGLEASMLRDRRVCFSAARPVPWMRHLAGFPGAGARRTIWRRSHLWDARSKETQAPQVLCPTASGLNTILRASGNPRDCPRERSWRPAESSRRRPAFLRSDRGRPETRAARRFSDPEQSRLETAFRHLTNASGAGRKFLRRARRARIAGSARQLSDSSLPHLLGLWISPG